MYRVRLDYFKPNGKWKYEGHYESECIALYHIWDEVRTMRDEDPTMPGLSVNHNSYNILIDVPDHPHRHPHLIMLKD